MTILISRINNNGVATQVRDIQTPLQKYLFQRNREQTVLPEEVIENLIDGILLVTEQKELIYANDCARRILRQLNQGNTLTSLVPGEIWHLCQTLIESRHLFPNQYWLIESKVCIDSSIVFNVRVKWLKLESSEHPYLLLSISDQYQYIKDIAIEESQKYGLTARERETWLLHRANYTYKQIASELCITPNTVKKHMKNIYLKQKAIFVVSEV
ncbi:MAG: helix-turn-helix transcriptional regulator [Cyanobacteria bacterium RM1_2_2]|nr:helix-turn-helix transcriptional regulator [Cyanobacteria bacterium RM1_2_2]